MLYYTSATSNQIGRDKKGQILENNQPLRDPDSVCNVKMPVLLRT